jgi:hypothetical protein
MTAKSKVANVYSKYEAFSLQSCDGRGFDTVEQVTQKTRTAGER